MGQVSLTLAMVMMIIITLLSSNTNYCRASTLIENGNGNTTYRCKGSGFGECLTVSDEISLEMELIFDTNIVRILQFDEQPVVGDQSKNANTQACPAGPGNPSTTNSNGVCGPPPKTPKNCPKYQIDKPC